MPHNSKATFIRQQRVDATFLKFAGRTSLAGIKQIQRAKSQETRVLWVGIFTFLFGFTLWNTLAVGIDFWSFPVTTIVNITSQTKILLPTVTLCNRNPVECSKLVALFLQHPGDEGLKNLLNYSNCLDTVSRPKSYSLSALIKNEAEPVQTWVLSLEKLLIAKNWSNIEAFNRQLTPECREGIKTINPREGQHSVIDQFLTNFAINCKSVSLKSLLFPEFEPRNFDVNSKKTFDTLETHFADRFYTELAMLYRSPEHRKFIQEISQGFEDFIVHCTQSGASCRSESLFRTTFIPKYGLCYTYNHWNVEHQNPENSSLEFANQIGPFNGLTVEMRFRHEEYSESIIGSGAGARVKITHPGELQNPNQDGGFVSPNTETNFAMNTFKVVRLPAPYESSCWDHWEQSPVIPFIPENATSNVSEKNQWYSQGDCQNLCFVALLIHKCNCTDYNSIQTFKFRGQMRNVHERFCDYATDGDKECFLEVLQSTTSTQEIGCECNPACVNVEYRITTSSSTWPSETYMDTVAKKYLQGSYWSENEERHDIVTDYARINVYFDTLDQIEVHEKPKYTLSTIMSDLGGAAGIYLGICGITLFEIAAFLVNFVKVIVTSKWRKSVEVKVANPGVKWDHPTLSTIT